MQDDPASEQRVCPQCGNVTLTRICPHDGWQTIPRARVDASVTAPTDVLGRWQASAVIMKDGRLSIWGGHEAATRRPVRIAVVGLPATAELADVARMQRGAKALEELAHKRLARVLATGLDERGDLVVVSEQVAGPPLTELLGQSFGPERTARLALQLFDALDAAHTAGVMHHELTPDHVRIVRDPDGVETVVVQDIGLADLARMPQGGVEPDPTQLDPFVARYRAPEQSRDRALTRHADLYAVGAMLYEMLCGRPVYDERTAADYLVAHLVKLPDRPTIDGEPVDGPLVELILRCLEKKPWNRPESAAAARDRLRESLGESIEEAPRQARVITSSVTRVVGGTGPRKSSRVVTGSRPRLPTGPVPPPLPAAAKAPPAAPPVPPLPAAAMPHVPHGPPVLPPLPPTPPPGPRPLTRTARRSTGSVVPVPVAAASAGLAKPIATAPVAVTAVDEPRREPSAPGPLVAPRSAPRPEARRPWWPWAIAVAALVAIAFVAVSGLGPDPITPAGAPVAERAPSERPTVARRPAPPTRPPAPTTKPVEVVAPAPTAAPVEAKPAAEALVLEPIDETPTAERPVAEPPEAPATKPAEEPAKPAEKPTKPTEKPAEKPTKPTEKPGEMVAEKPLEKPAEKVADPGPAAATRRAMVTSTPDGAGVWVDGRRIGRTPMTVSWFDGDEPTLKLALDGYQDGWISLESGSANRMLSLALIKDTRPPAPAPGASKPATPTGEPSAEPGADAPPEEETPKKSLLEREWRPR